MAEKEEIIKLIESLSPNERKIIKFLAEGNLDNISKSSGLDKTSALRALEFLSNKRILKLSTKQEQSVDLGVNGILYKKRGLPERKLANLIAEKNSVSLNDAKNLSGLSENELKVALGALKKKALINIINGNIVLAFWLASIRRPV